MASLSVDGLISGLDTTTLISQLMQIEAQPQARLKASVSGAQTAIAAYQSVNLRLSAVATAATALQKATTWTQSTASASSTAVTVSAGDSALAGTLTFSVDQLAAAKSVVSQEFTSRTDPTSFTGFPIEIRGSDGTVKASISPSEGSLDAIVSAINQAANSGVRAVAVQVAPGHYRLQVTATGTGTAADFSITGADGQPLAGLGLSTVTEAQDARLHVGPAAGGYDVTSPTNTVEGLMTGVTVQLNTTTDAVNVTATPNPRATADAVQGLVDATNAALAEIKRQTSTGSANPDGSRQGQGVLAGNGLMRDLSMQLVSAVTNAVGGSSGGSAGLSITRDGVLTLDRAKLMDQLGKDPNAVKAVFAPSADGTGGIAARLSALVKTATQSGSGTITLAIAGQNSMIKDLSNRIADWDVRLQTRQDSLKRTYSALEVSLSQLKSQSSWLAGQLNSLSSSSSSS